MWEEVLCILTETDKQFPTPISEVTKIGSYSKKLSVNAYWAFAENDGINCGIVAYYLNKDKRQIYITYVFVYPEYRKQHVASQILDYLSRTYDGDYKSMALEVLKTNMAAFDFYRKRNFEIIEDRPETYLMQLSLS